jgi:hypothetical protein
MKCLFCSETKTVFCSKLDVVTTGKLDDQFTREAFQFCCPDSHPFLRESKRSLCQEHPGFEIHEGMVMIKLC